MDGPILLSSLALVVSCTSLVGLLALAREVGLLLARVSPNRPLVNTSEGADLGTKIAFELTTVTGENLKLGEVSERKRLMLFTSPRCVICEDLKPSLKVFARDYRDEIELVVLSIADDDPADRAFALEIHSLRAYLAFSPEAHRAFNVLGTPYAMLIAQDGEVLARGAVSDLQQLESLLGIEMRVNKVGVMSHGMPVFKDGRRTGEEGQ